MTFEVLPIIERPGVHVHNTATTDPRPEPIPAATPPGALACATKVTGHNAVWIGASGEVDLFTAPQLARELTDGLSRADLVVLDLRDVRFLDCTGVRVIVEAAHAAGRDHQHVVAVRPPEPVARFLSYTDPAKQLEFVTLDDLSPLAGLDPAVVAPSDAGKK